MGQSGWFRIKLAQMSNVSYPDEQWAAWILMEGENADWSLRLRCGQPIMHIYKGMNTSLL